MTRTVQVTVTLRLDISAEMSGTEFYDQLPGRLRTGLGTMLPAALDDVRVIAASDPEQELSRPTDLDTLLAPDGRMAFIWSTEDVREIRPDLTDAEAYLVLQCLQKNHDANFGVNWDTIAYQAALLFGEPAEVEP